MGQPRSHLLAYVYGWFTEGCDTPWLAIGGAHLSRQPDLGAADLATVTTSPGPCGTRTKSQHRQGTTTLPPELQGNGAIVSISELATGV